jgi:hypothetical protein
MKEKGHEFPTWTKAEETLRELLFRQHPCDGKYGDDGEMQCAACKIDFRRDTAEEIRTKMNEVVKARIAAYAKEREDPSLQSTLANEVVEIIKRTREITDFMLLDPAVLQVVIQMVDPLHTPVSSMLLRAREIKDDIRRKTFIKARELLVDKMILLWLSEGLRRDEHAFRYALTDQGLRETLVVAEAKLKKFKAGL